MEQKHLIERLIGRYIVRRILGWLSAGRAGRLTVAEKIIYSYRNPDWPTLERLAYLPFHLVIDYLRGDAPVESVRERIASHRPTVMGIVAAMRSIAAYGLTMPQRFTVPLFVVWNFTNRCNLRCRHCYQSSNPAAGDGELTLDEKLRIVDELGENYVPMIAFAGGEPTLSPDLLPVLHRCKRYGMHTSVATHGGTMTARLAEQLAEAGVRYVEISLDSVRPERHDTFRGVRGMWHRTVRGMIYVARQNGLRLGVAMCVHRENFDEVLDMLHFCVDIGADCFAHFNFIPVGRGEDIADADLTPAQRERLLQILHEWMQSGRLGVISTAPQLGRICLMHAPLDGRITCSHAGSGSGMKARIVARYLGGCGAGRTYIAIQPNGDVTPCVYMPDRVMGNARSRSVIEIFRTSPLREVLSDRENRWGTCLTCDYRYYCGGCRARADAYFGDLRGPDPGCLLNEAYWRQVADRADDTDGPVVPPQDHAFRLREACALSRRGFNDGLWPDR